MKRVITAITGLIIITILLGGCSKDPPKTETASESDFNYYIDIEPNPDEVAAWDKAGEWDVSELLIITEYINWSRWLQHEAVIISLDGKVKKIDFSEYPDLGYHIEIPRADYWDNCIDIMLNCTDDDRFPVTAQYEKIPDDIIESARTLGPVVLDIWESKGADMGIEVTYIAVGIGDDRRLIGIGKRGDNIYSSSDYNVNYLYYRIERWMRDEWDNAESAGKIYDDRFWGF